MEYRRILEHVEKQGFWESGQGDGTVALELYTLCSDGKYHKLDHCGHKLATMVVPLNKMEVESLANNNRGVSLSSTTDRGIGDDEGDGSHEGQQYLNDRIRLLRSMLEWGSDLRNGGEEEDGDGGIGASTSSSSSSSSEKNNVSPLSTSPDSPVLKSQQYPSSITISKEVMVLVWPGGRILRLPRGTTAGDAVKRLKPSTGYKTTRKSRSGGSPALTSSSKDASYPMNQEQQQKHVVNVNNRFVSGDTPLVDGDYIVLGREKLKV
jgi:hypothetical protein